MPLGAPGPRDWSPTDYALGSGARANTQWSTTRARTRIKAWPSLVLGMVALLVAFLQPGTGRAEGYLVSTVGVLAIATAVPSLRSNRSGPLRVRVAARLGLAFGALGSLVMVYSMLVFGLAPVGIGLPPDPLTFNRIINSAASPGALTIVGSGAAPGVASRPNAAPSTPAIAAPVPQHAPIPSSTPSTAMFPTPRSADVELAQLQLVMSGLQTILLDTHPAGSAWPGHLIVSPAANFELVALPTGRNLIDMPPNTRLTYSISSDGTEYSVILVGGTFGATVRYDSASGSQTGAP